MTENNTGELPRFEQREPSTPAERVVEAGDRLRGLLGSVPMTDVERLAKTGGAIGMIRDVMDAARDFQLALLETAQGAKNRAVEGFLQSRGIAGTDVDPIKPKTFYSALVAAEGEIAMQEPRYPNKPEHLSGPHQIPG